jgi:hypothetical protein
MPDHHVAIAASIHSGKNSLTSEVRDAGKRDFTPAHRMFYQAGHFSIYPDA